MNEIEFMRWLTSNAIFECSSPYRHTFDPIRGFWSIEDDCNRRTIVLYDTQFNDVYKVFVDRNLEEQKEEITKLFKL